MNWIKTDLFLKTWKLQQYISHMCMPYQVVYNFWQYSSFVYSTENQLVSADAAWSVYKWSPAYIGLNFEIGSQIIYVWTQRDI